MSHYSCICIESVRVKDNETCFVIKKHFLMGLNKLGQYIQMSQEQNCLDEVQVHVIADTTIHGKHIIKRYKLGHTQVGKRLTTG